METLQYLLPLFTDYGYLAVFLVLLICGLGVPIPEDITLVAGGIIAGLGFANVHWMFAVGMAGVLVGDTFMFFAGHHWGEGVLRWRWVARLLTPARYAAVQDKFCRYGNRVLFVARFLPGLRSPIFLTAGMSKKIPYWRFLALDGAAALISVPVWVYLGYYGAYKRDWLMMWIKRGQGGLLLVILVVLVGVAIWAWRRHRARCRPS
ncbi:membrane protein DedA, SNARE-associated domain [Andreprevotia lacus DSM 23236]|jgi:membrane protein DedA with SNARE-associated domain|uniref:Membrane protein DedA, SNARE-associated domain n=1 Tax=Andreprevotia lacus DSM 23236 TaxID=1121001 RepID=A0A1W1X6K0_9NEIS|nr:DedA family protein [Andreprevotia lacus]SMC19474.1 membrane protein DedA, SNARE-associated domain [Andreprevotia lacus DSM 23236]